MSIILGDDEPAGTGSPADEPLAPPPAEPAHMWDLEGRYPWGMALLYALAILAGLLGSHVVACWAATWWPAGQPRGGLAHHAVRRCRMNAGPNTAPAADWSPDEDKAAGIERRAYVQGWWLGFASGLICGAASTAMLVWLLWLVACALGGSTC